MGDIGFNRSFGMVESGEEANVIKLLHDSQAPLSVLVHTSWAMRLIARTPIGSQPLFEHIDWSAKVLEERKKITPKEKDVFSCLLDPNNDQITPEMNADSRLLIIAGSDTVSATLSYLLYELCKNLKIQAKLRTVIDTIEPEKAHLDVEDVTECAFLDGVINETLRLHPATPSGPQRETPPEGLTLPDGTYIPGEVNVWIPIYSLQRDSRYWEDPLSFMPERWTDERPSANIEKRAFLPFLTGPYNCIGQKLAMMELRSVTANLIRSFEITFAEGENGSTIENKSQDCFTMNVGKLDVRLTPRYKH
jgi:cytochrome P450